MMHLRKGPWGILALCLATSIGCGFPKAGPVPGPVSPGAATNAKAKWPGTTDESLASGRALFAAKCNACHSHPDVKAISEEKWPSILDRMAKKADLSQKEHDDVLHFVLAARSE